MAGLKGKAKFFSITSAYRIELIFIICVLTAKPCPGILLPQVKNKYLKFQIKSINAQKEVPNPNFKI